MELSNLLDGARQTETKMVEMSALNHLMATHVLQQAQQIEVLYDQVKDLVTPTHSLMFNALFYMVVLSLCVCVCTVSHSA